MAGISIIFIENDQGQFLIQKTAPSRGSIFATTGGHVDYGSTFFDTIKKEVKEELGIDVSNDKIIEVNTYIGEYYIQKVYYLKKNINIDDIKIQQEEVECVEWLDQKTIDQLIEHNQFRVGNIKGYRYIIDNKDVI